MKTIKFYTLGCKVNQYDTQELKERFLSCGFKETSNGKPADYYLINTCTVTQSADRKSRYLINFAHRQNPKAKIIVTGCYAQLDKKDISGISGVTHIIKNSDKQRILEIIGAQKRLKKQNRLKDSGITAFSGRTRAFLKIQDGCNNLCSYCKVPLVRGKSRSKALIDIVQEAGQLVKNGFKEIVLTGICLGGYGKDLKEKINLVDVISALEKMGGLYRIRLSSIEAGDVSDTLIKKMAVSKKLCPHLHIPIQSGDDEILKKMNRKYKGADYLRLIRKIKSIVPGIAITTDVMVGFPGEGEANFRNTLKLVKKIKPLKAHIFPYSKRKATAAASFKEEINPKIIRERIARLNTVDRLCADDYKKGFLNKKFAVLIEGRHKENRKFYEGFTDNYLPVLVKSESNLNNRLVSIYLKEIKDGHLLGQRIESA
ncbi:MAG: tRNA (N(6)-L-threonylcarbamoyladenosine(37)-C(2))-methylthiotransferase MtaB [Candidatus Omnitrophota bacterium]